MRAFCICSLVLYIFIYLPIHSTLKKITCDLINPSRETVSNFMKLYFILDVSPFGAGIGLNSQTFSSSSVRTLLRA